MEDDEDDQMQEVNWLFGEFDINVEEFKTWLNVTIEDALHFDEWISKINSNNIRTKIPAEVSATNIGNLFTQEQQKRLFAYGLVNNHYSRANPQELANLPELQYSDQDNLFIMLGTTLNEIRSQDMIDEFTPRDAPEAQRAKDEADRK